MNSDTVVCMHTELETERNKRIELEEQLAMVQRSLAAAASLTTEHVDEEEAAAAADGDEGREEQRQRQRPETVVQRRRREKAAAQTRAAEVAGASTSNVLAAPVVASDRPCAQQYVGKSQSCMVTSGRSITQGKLWPVQLTRRRPHELPKR